MKRHGRVLTEYDRSKIRLLLANSDMSMTAIAERMGVSKSTVFVINKQHSIRDYNGKRASYAVVR